MEKECILTFHVVVNSWRQRYTAKHLLRHWPSSYTFHRCLKGLEVTGMTVTIVGGGPDVDNRALLGDDR